MVEGPLVEYGDRRLDGLLRDDEISAETARLIADSVPANTRRAYANDRAAFRRWCEMVQRTPLPATAETATEYVRFLAEGGPLLADGSRNGPAAPASINRALSAIRTEHEMAGYEGRPSLRAARMLINGHRKRRAKEDGIREKQAAALTLEELRAIVDACDPNTMAGARDRALIVLGFAMMIRRSELVALNTIGDLTDTDDGVDVLIRWSKTDQDAIGEQAAVNYGAHAGTCPVRLLRAWRQRLAASRPTEGPLWVPIDQKDRPPWVPGYSGRSETGRLSDKAVGLIVKSAARRAGVETAALSAHSLRAGGATAAYKAGSDMLTISRRGRWKDGSPVLLRYIRDKDRWSQNPMAGVL